MPPQSETAGLQIPEIDLELNPGTLGGRFTTLEGLLQQVYEELDEKVFARGDASAEGVSDGMQAFLANLKKVRAGVRACAQGGPRVWLCEGTRG